MEGILLVSLLWKVGEWLCCVEIYAGFRCKYVRCEPVRRN